MITDTDHPWRPALDELHRRNAPVEVTGITPVGSDKVAPTYRLRLLEVSNERMVLERPAQPDAAQYFRTGAEVRVLAVDGEKRWDIFTVVTGLSAFQLNATMRVPAVELSMPGDGRSAQRRCYFRVNTAGGNLGPVVMTPVVSPAAAPSGKSDLDEPIAFFARLVNVGGAGLGVEAPPRVTGQLRRVNHYLCRLDLPTLDEPLEVQAQLVHLSPLQGGKHYLGLCFEIDEPAERRRVEDLLCRFTAEYQRQQIQRTRGT